MRHNRILGRLTTGLLVLTMLGGFAVDVGTRVISHRASRALSTTLGRLTPLGGSSTNAAERAAHESGSLEEPALLGEPMLRRLETARVAARHGDALEVARQLTVITEEHPAAPLHNAASRALLAAGDGSGAARHAQLAARLAPTNAALARRADRSVDIALLFQAKPLARGALVLALGLLMLIGLQRGARGRVRQRRRQVADDMSGAMRLVIDGEAVTQAATVTPYTEQVTVDVFFRGRYGMAKPSCRRRGPALHLAFSSASASETIRLRSIPNVQGDAIRVPLRPSTLAHLRRRPGAWRLHARLDDRTIALADLHVEAASGAPVRV